MQLELILSIHNHQPAGNFEDVIEDASRKGYLPFIEIMKRYPKIKFVLHYSGYLLSYLKKKHPELIRDIKRLVREKRVEILTGGFYEPMLSVIPEKDAIIQIKKLSQEIKKTFGYQPHGMWLAERIWEPHLSGLLKKAGVRYLSLDDHHFKLAGFKENDLYGYFITEHGGDVVYIFPGSERLRYLIPFRPIEEVMRYLNEFKECVKERGNNITPLLVLSDDGEKFGIWPGTYRHCYDDGWLDAFFKEISSKDWIKTNTFSEYIKNNRPLGIAYLPQASYREMGEWTLPPERALKAEGLYKELTERFGEEAKYLLNGGIWRNFFVKYPESNHLHKRMLYLSDYVHKSKNKDALETHLMSQCNDGYWHGIFGGLYLPHLRGAIYKNILKTQTLLERKGIFPFIVKGDMDFDGYKDILLSNKNLTLFITERGGAIIEFGIKKIGINLFDVLTRRKEAYHDAILKRGKTEDKNGNESSTKTIHERFDIKEEGLENYLIYDSARKASLIDRFIPFDASLNDIERTLRDSGDFCHGIYNMKVTKNGVELMRSGRLKKGIITLNKLIVLDNNGLDIRYSLNGEFEELIGTEFNISIAGSPQARFSLGERIFGVTEKILFDNVETFELSEDDIKVIFETSSPARVVFYPIYTVSLSESGVERIYQGTSILFIRDGSSKEFFYKLRVY